MTEQDKKLKMALALKFPDLIEISEQMIIGGKVFFSWKENNQPITEREWNWIASEVATQLYRRDYYIYWNLLDQICMEANGGGYDGHKGHPGNATWQQKAIAFFQIRKHHENGTELD